MFSSQEHHRKDSFCLTRPAYRNGKKLRAVKVFTVGQESKYILIQNLPSIGGSLEQLLPELNRFGTVEQHYRLDEYQSEENDPFLDTVLVKFQRIDHARRCKISFDDRNFLGANLHICYAPEFETIDDLREKLDERRKIVQHKSELNRRRTDSNRIELTNEIRRKIRELVENSNLIPIVLNEKPRKRKRLQL